MNRLIPSLTLAASLAGLLASAPIQARDLKTMRAENDLPRPAGVAISGARPDQVVLYCPEVHAACKGLREHLHKSGIDFVDKDPKGDPVAGSEFDALGGQGVPLVVFKHRLMHSYYPTSFDRLYAQYHAGSPPASAAAARSDPSPRPSTAAPSPRPSTVAPVANPPVVASTVASGLPGAAVLPRLMSGRVEEVAPAAIEAWLKLNPNALVQFTSYDPGCRFCVESYQAFNSAARAYADRIKFARVHWSRWLPFPEEVEKPYSVGGIPEQIVFKNGKQIGRFGGTLLNRGLEFDTFIQSTYALADSARSNPVWEVDAEALAEFLRRHARVAVQFTSPDPNCAFCVQSYQSFDEVARTHRGGVKFVRVQWMPYAHAPSVVYQAYELRVVPGVVLFQNRQVAGKLLGAPSVPKLHAQLKQSFGDAQ